MINYCFACLLAVLVLAMQISCTGNLSPVAGGTEIGNPAVVSGMVVLSENQPVNGASAYLLDTSYNPATGGSMQLQIGELDSTSSMHMVQTDSDGVFIFHGVARKIYNLYVFDTVSGSCVIKRNLRIDSAMVDLGMTMMQTSGIGIFNITDSIYSPDCYIIVPGTPISIKVPKPGSYSIPLPADTMKVICYQLDNNHLEPLGPGPGGKSFVHPGDTLDFSGAKPESARLELLIEHSPDDIRPLKPIDTLAVNDSVIHVIAVVNIPDIKEPGEYQFSIMPDSLITPWSSRNYIDLMVKPGSYQYISCSIHALVMAQDTVITTITYTVFRPEGFQ